MLPLDQQNDCNGNKFCGNESNSLFLIFVLMSIPEKWRVSDDDEAMAEVERTEFSVEDFKEKISERTTDFDRKNFPAANWANHCW